MTKAIQIDVINKKINEVEYEDYKEIYNLVNCRIFDVVRIDEDTDCFIDDESLLKDGYIDENGTRHNLSGFKFNNQLIMGNGLLVGFPDEDGENTDCQLTKEQVENAVTFIDFDREEDRPQPFVNIYSW